MKNKDLIKSNINEAKEQLEEIIKDLETDPDFSESEFQVSLEHAYHHLNFAWHIRNVAKSQAKDCSERDFKKWSKFPINEIDEYE